MIKLHLWTLTPSEAIALQKKLAQQIDTQTPLAIDRFQWVAGVDVSVKNEISHAAIVILTFPDLQVIESVTAQMPTPFPYIPGLLSFREGPVILAAREKLQHQPDVYIFDGAGIAHPRRIGIAAHMGLWFDAPTIGCAKTWLTGTHAPLGEQRGSFEYLHDKGDQIGVVLRTRDRVKPVYISPGHQATIDSARDLILRCVTKYRLPEPIRAAHNAAGKF